MKILEEFISIIKYSTMEKDIRHINSQYFSSMFIDRINLEIENEVPNVDVLKKISFVSITLEGCNVPT